VSGVVPLYPLYALLFADTGLSDADISVLFVIWSGVGIVAEVPMGALADRFTRRHVIAAAGLAQAAGYVLWTVLPGFAGFAAGFVLWGLGGAAASGALEALVHDDLSAAGAADRYSRVLARIRAAELLAQLPNAAAATVLFTVGGYPLVGWASVGMCLCATVLATRLPEAPKTDDDGPGYFATLRSGVSQAAARPSVRGAVVAVALLGGLDAFEEYFSLLANEWGVPVVAIPLAVLVVPVAGALGAAVGGRHHRLRPAVLAATLATGVVVLGAAGVLHRPVGLLGLALFYGCYRFVLLVADARLQDRITGPARATVTSVAELGTELTCLLVYAAWALDRVTGVAVLCLIAAVVLPFSLRHPVSGPSDHEAG
jgi:MFS family permease